MKKLFNCLTVKNRMLSHANVVVVAIAAVVFASCAKEPLMPVNIPNAGNSPISSRQNTQAKGITTTYNACGMSVNAFAPPQGTSNLYSFAYTITGQQKKFGIAGTAGQMNFSSYDKFSFEFAGYLDSPTSTVKCFKIKRTDGKYLTKGLTYSGKLAGAQEVNQIFLLSSLGNNQYKLLLPKISSCSIAAIWYDIDLGYRIANFIYNDSHLTGKDTNIGMTIIPLINN